MNGLNYGAAPFAQFANGGNGESQEREFDVFLLARLGEHELANDIVDIRQRYGAVMAQYKQQKGIELQTKVDELILIARDKRAAFEQANDSALNAANAHMAAEQTAARYRRNVVNLRYEIDNDRALLTTTEKSQRLAKLRELEQQHQQAQVAESEAFTKVRNRKYEADSLLAEAKAADAAAKDAAAQLATMTDENNGSSVRFSTSTGFQV